MASVTDRLIDNREDDVPSSDDAPTALPSSHTTAYQSVTIPTNVTERPQVESPTEAPSSFPTAAQIPQPSQSSHIIHPISRNRLSRAETVDVPPDSDPEQTSDPLLAPTRTQETIKPDPSASPPPNGRRPSSMSNYVFAGLEHVRSKFSPADHTEKASMRSRWSSTSAYDTTPLSTARPFKRKRQTWRLWRLAMGEFVISAVLCSLFIIVVVHYDAKDIMYPSDQAWYNAYSLCIIFLLGASIAASFRSYAKLLRWRILAFRYRTLETFDLVLACDSLANVFKLLYKGGRHAQEERKYMRYVPTLIQVVCASWIMLKVTALFLVGYAGSLASLEAGRAYVGREMGNTSTTSFAALGGIDSDAKLARMQTWGSRGFRYTGSQGIDYDSARLSTFSTLKNGTAAYWPKVFDPSDRTTQAVSYRRIRADAVCVAYNVTDGQFGNQSSITYIDDNGTPTNFWFPKSAQPGPGGFLASSNIKSTCGPRCINVSAFLARTLPGSPIVKPGKKMTISYEQAKFFKCNNTVAPVQSYDGNGNLEDASEEFALTDSWAQMAAGAIGWQSEMSLDTATTAGDGKRPTAMFIPYPALSEMSTYFALRYPSTPNATEMADMVASVPMCALAALDDSTTGLGVFNYSMWYPPVRSQHLVADEPLLIGVVGAIIASQFLALAVVFFFATGAPIKDDSPISLAKFYLSFLQQHGFSEGGSLLKGRDIIDRIGNRRVKYGWTMREGEVRGVGILEEDVEKQDRRESSSTFADRKKHYIYD